MIFLIVLIDLFFWKSTFVKLRLRYPEEKVCHDIWYLMTDIYWNPNVRQNCASVKFTWIVSDEVILNWNYKGPNIKETFWFGNFSGLAILRFSYTVGLIKTIINNRYCQFDWITFYSRTIPKILWLRLNLATAQCGWSST